MTGATESVMRQPYAVPETKRAAAHRLFAGGRRETGLIAQVLRALLDLGLAVRESVGPRPPDAHVRAGASVDRVVSSPAADAVVPASGVDRVDARAPKHQLGGRRAVEGARTGDETGQGDDVDSLRPIGGDRRNRKEGPGTPLQSHGLLPAADHPTFVPSASTGRRMMPNPRSDPADRRSPFAGVAGVEGLDAPLPDGEGAPVGASRPASPAARRPDRRAMRPGSMAAKNPPREP